MHSEEMSAKGQEHGGQSRVMFSMEEIMRKTKGGRQHPHQTGMGVSGECRLYHRHLTEAGPVSTVCFLAHEDLLVPLDT